MTNELDTPTTLQKVIVASGTKVAIGNTLDEAITNLLSQSAVNIEIDNTEDIDGMIRAIIDANNNLKESNESNDWEMIGSDIKELQSLIDSLDKMLEEQDSTFGTSTTDTTETTENNQQDDGIINSIFQNVIN